MQVFDGTQRLIGAARRLVRISRPWPGAVECAKRSLIPGETSLGLPFLALLAMAASLAGLLDLPRSLPICEPG